jgi:LmbE family N-acetylglucosaminyl deacetylase
VEENAFMNVVLFSPHSDDEGLFACYIMQRSKPTIFIVNDCYFDWDDRRGRYAEISPEASQQNIAKRRGESVAAARILGLPVEFLGLEERRYEDSSLTKLHWEKLEREFGDILRLKFNKDLIAIAPALQGGNPVHDFVSRIVGDYFPNHIFYATYEKAQPFTQLGQELSPTTEEIEIKNSVLECYSDQLWTIHFKAVKGASEWFTASSETARAVLKAR